nr:MAG TPA: hypothetical protein [Inoviridae sp.]
MSAIKLRKILLLSVSLLVFILYPLTAFAMAATPSEVMKVPVATSSNAFPSQEYMEMDDFDTLDIPVLMSDGDSSHSSTVDLSNIYVRLSYYDMSGKVCSKVAYLNSDGYFSMSAPSDLASIRWITFYVPLSSLPSTGNYRCDAYFGSNTGGFTYNGMKLQYDYIFTNANTDYTSYTNGFVQSSGDWSFSQSIKIPYQVKSMQFVFDFKNLSLPYGGYFSLSFTKLSSGASVDYQGTDYSSSTNVAEDTANNTAQLVEKQDTIIDQIMNVTQTISSQLTAFWNQLAGEFTNLYNKMNQQHAEQLEADRMNTDNIIAADDANTNKVTTAIESHGNFIIEGLKKLFIPSDEYFKAYFDDLYSWFSERFGFLSFPIDLLLEVIDIFVNSSQTDCVLVLPSFTIMENLLWPEMSFNLTEFLNTNFSFVVVAIKTVTSIYLVMAFVQLCEEKWNEVMMN